MIPTKLPLQLLLYIFPGRSRHWWQRHANAGQLGPVSADAGKVRNRWVETSEVMSRFEVFTEQRYAEAVRQYEADRRLVRRAP